MGRRAFWGKVDVQNYVIWIRGEEECEEEQVWIQCLNTLDHLMYECHLSPMEWDIHVRRRYDYTNFYENMVSVKRLDLNFSIIINNFVYVKNSIEKKLLKK